jgi:hypothetical protein
MRMYGETASMIQASLDQSSKVRIRETEGKRRTKYYNKRPAGEKKGAEAMGEAPAFCLGALRGRRGRGLDRAEHGRGWGEIGWEAGGYLQRLNVWRQRQPGCTTAGPRLIGCVRDEQVKWGAGGGGGLSGQK